MKLDCYLVPSEVTEATLSERVVVIVDVLRACTTMTHALFNGAEKILPAASIEAATKLTSSLDKGSTLLCGERDGKMVKGFDLGNSPLEYTREVVENKTLVFATTNGTKLMAKGLKAREQLVCAFINVGRVVAQLKPEGAESAVVCAGRTGYFSLEDTVCAGMVVSKVCEAFPGAWELNDGAIAARALYEKFGGDILGMLRNSSHGRYLASLGFEQDIEVCSRVDSVPVLPVAREGRVTLHNG
ncbi:MAG: 2-phosphosulfolactate phosphatase [Candidatus Eisenbacteria bacterium]